MPTDLRSSLDRLAPAPSTPLDLPALQRRAQRRTMTRRTAVGAVAAAVVAAGTIVATRPSAEPPVVQQLPGVDGQWEPMPEAPLAPRVEAQTLSSGDHVVIWGGHVEDPETGETTRLLDGAVYDLFDDAWTYVPPPPAEVLSERDRQQGIGVWPYVLTDDLLVVQSQGLAGWYSFAEERWHVIGPAPLAPRLAEVTEWVDGSIFVWGGVPGRGEAPYDDGAVYSLADGSWSPVAASPLSARSEMGREVLDGRVVLFGGMTGSVHAGTEVTFVDAAVYDLRSGIWELLPTSPLSPRKRASVIPTADGFVVFGGSGPEHEQASSPQPGPTFTSTQECSGDRCSVTVGGVMVGVPPLIGDSYDDGAAFDVARGTWTLLPPSGIDGYYFPLRDAAAPGALPPIVASGASVQAILEPSTATWRRLDSPPASYYDFGWTGNGDLIARPPVQPRGENDTAPLVLGAESWRTTGDPPTGPRAGAAVAAVGDGTIIMWGGALLERGEIAGYRQGPPLAEGWRLRLS